MYSIPSISDQQHGLSRKDILKHTYSSNYCNQYTLANPNLVNQNSPIRAPHFQKSYNKFNYVSHLLVWKGNITYSLTHIDTLKSLQTNLKDYVPLPNSVWKLLRKIYDHIRVWKCVSATCAISGSSGTNLTMSMICWQMFRKLKSMLIHICRLISKQLYLIPIKFKFNCWGNTISVSISIHTLLLSNLLFCS